MDIELQTTCSALGCLDSGIYCLEPDCIESLKDVIKYLRQDDRDTCRIRRWLGEWRLVCSDLLPILQQHAEQNAELFDVTLRVLVNLTQPALICFGGKLPTDTNDLRYVIQINDHLKSYKPAFANLDILLLLTAKLTEILEKDWENRQEEDRMQAERIFILIRNVLEMPSTNLDKGLVDGDSTVQDRIIMCLHESGFVDLVLYIAAASASERPFMLYALQITSLMLKEQTPENLASAGGVRSTEERQKDERALKEIRARESIKKEVKLKHSSVRPNGFYGSYCVKGVKAVDDGHDLVTHRMVRDQNYGAIIEDLTHDRRKRGRKIPKNRAPLQDCDQLGRRPAQAVRIAMKEFCIRFLNQCYNHLMRNVKNIISQSRHEEHGEVYYMWAIHFFMRFRRLVKAKLDRVSETISMVAFHFIQVQFEDYLDLMCIDKDQSRIWGRRSHVALKAYNELLLTLAHMETSGHQRYANCADSIKANIFYMTEYRDLPLVLLKKYNPVYLSKSYLQDLIQTLHIYFRLMETTAKSRGGSIVIQKKVKKSKTSQSSKKPKSNGKQPPGGMTEDAKTELWDGIVDSLSMAITHPESLPTDAVPYDALDESVDPRIQATRRIQNAIQEQQAELAVALFHAARDLWPDHGHFGGQNMATEDEFLALRQILFADLPADPNAVAEPEPEEAEEEDGDPVIREEFGDDEGPTKTGNVVAMESEIGFVEYIQRFAHPDILKWYLLVLQDYQINSTDLNHQVLKMLHRVGFDMQRFAMLYNAKLFRIFQKIFNDPVAAKAPHLEEIRTFALYILGKFFESIKVNNLLIVEILFFRKSAKDCHELEHGYGSYAKTKQSGAAWTEELEAELIALYKEYVAMEEKPEGQDVADFVVMRGLSRPKTRKAVILHLKNLQLDLSGILRQQKIAGGVGDWTEVEEDELRDLYARFEGSVDPVGAIIAQQSEPRARTRIVNKLVKMGLVRDKLMLTSKNDDRARAKFNDQIDAADGGGEQYDYGHEFNSDNDDRDEDDEDVGGGDGHARGVEHAGTMGSQAQSIKLRPRTTEEIEQFDAIRLEIQSDEGLRAAVYWLKETLEDIGDDVEEGESAEGESIPIVPIIAEEAQFIAMDRVQSIMTLLGLKKPDCVQEQYWRVPGVFSSFHIRRLAESLECNSSIPLPGVPEMPQVLSSPLSLINSDEVVEPAGSRPSSSMSKADADARLSVKSISMKKRRPAAFSDSEDENRDESVSEKYETEILESSSSKSKQLLRNVSKQSPASRPSRKKCRKARVLSDDDDENTEVTRASDRQYSVFEGERPSAPPTTLPEDCLANQFSDLFDAD